MRTYIITTKFDTDRELTTDEVATIESDVVDSLYVSYSKISGKKLNETFINAEANTDCVFVDSSGL